MKHKVIRDNFPSFTEKDLERIENKISDKCSDYFFVDFLKTTKGNIQDAYRLFVFDENFRCLLFKYVLRFEIQIKNYFVECLIKETKDLHFWSNPKYFIFKDEKEFSNLRKKIEDSFKNLNIKSAIADSYAATYVMSFGTFIQMFKNINPNLKRKFVQQYTKYLPIHNFDVLYKYLLCMRALRNRCAHGTHIVSNSFVNQLSQFSAIQKEECLNPNMKIMSIFELTLYFLMNLLNCKNEFSKDLKHILEKNKNLYSRYGGKQPINPSIIEKLFAQKN